MEAGKVDIINSTFGKALGGAAGEMSRGSGQSVIGRGGTQFPTQFPHLQFLLKGVPPPENNKDARERIGGSKAVLQAAFLVIQLANL